MHCLIKGYQVGLKIVTPNMFELAILNIQNPFCKKYHDLHRINSIINASIIELTGYGRWDLMRPRLIGESIAAGSFTTKSFRPYS